MSYGRLDPPTIPMAIMPLYLVESATADVFEFSESPPADAFIIETAAAGVWEATETPGGAVEARLVLAGSIGLVVG